jgi:hypothetical protein
MLGCFSLEGNPLLCGKCIAAMDDGEYCILREETVRERRGSYNGFCCRLYPFICWIIIKEGPGNFSGGRRPHWVNHVNLCLSCIVCLFFFFFLHLFYFIALRSYFSNTHFIILVCSTCVHYTMEVE